MRRTRLGWAGLLSLLIHAALLALVWVLDPEHPVSASPEPHPLVVEVISSPLPAPAPAPLPPPPARTERPRPPPRALPVPRPLPARPPPPERPSAEPSTAEQAPPLEVPPLAATASTGPEASPSSSAAERSSAPTAASLPLDSRLDVPLAAEVRRPSLVPSIPSGDWSLPSTEEKPRGRTLHADDPSLSPEGLAAEENARVSSRMRTFTEDDLAARRVENGQVDPYFSELRTALEKQLEGAPVFMGKSAKQKLQRFVQSYLKDAENYGRNTLAGKSRDAHAPPTPSEQFESLAKGDPNLNQMRGFLKEGEALQEHAETDSGLVVVLELQQAPDGQLRSVQVVEPSGNTAFDKYVVDAVPSALARLTPPPSKALGVHSNGLRSLWAVSGRIVYLKRLSEMKGEDSLYMAGMATVGALAGNFEETTGEVRVIDFRNPKFSCSPRLLRVW
jgi:outer membrane biosynthesis protein TonB